MQKSGANNGKNCHACDSSEPLIKTCTKQRNIFVTYKERREIIERYMINIMEEYGTIKRLKVQNNIHTNNSKALICFETMKEVQRAIPDVNQYPGWKASLYQADIRYREIKKKVEAIQTIQQKTKNRKKIQTYHQRHDDSNEEIIVIHNIDASEMKCHVFGLKGHKIKEYQLKQNIYIVNLKKTVRSKLEIQEEMQQYGNIKSIKVRRDRYGYEINEAMICYTTQREAEEAISEINKGTEWHAKIYQNRYTEINEGRNKKTKENSNNGESKRNKTNKERQKGSLHCRSKLCKSKMEWIS